MFGPGRAKMILISLISYIIFALIWFGVRLFKKRYKN